MKGTMRAVAAWVVILVAAIMAGIGASENTNGKSFPYLDPAFTQHLFGSTSSFKISGGNLGGVAVLPNGDVVVAECVTKDTRLHKFLAATTIERRSTTIHPETIVPSAGGCGLTYHPDGSLYLNMDDGAFGVANVNANGTTRRLFGPRGNALGIAVDPITNHLVYAGRTCRPGQGSTCTLFDLDPVTGVATNRAVLLSSAVGYVDGIAFDPTGAYIFLANRFPQKRLTILTRAGAIVQHVAMTPEPIGIWFHSDPPAFVVTNNMDGSMSRFDFPGNVYAQPPAITQLADQGFRGDLIQAGADGCLYVTQGGSRYDNGDVEDGNEENSIVQICAGFAVPPGLTPAPPSGTLDGTVTDLVTTNPIAGATVLLSDGATTTTDSTGHYSFTLAPGTYDVTVTATGYNNAIANGLVVTNRNKTTKDFTLTRPAGTLNGVVTDTTGALVTTATITLSTGLSTATDGIGSYSFTVPPGTYGATVTAPGYNSASASGIVVTSGGTTRQNFTLTPLNGTLQGAVKDSAGNAIASATVALSGGTSRATTDSAGHYSITIAPGTYAATVTATNYNNATASGLLVTAGGTTTKDFTLVPLPGTLQGVVTSTNPAGTPIVGATVKLADGTPATTNATGIYKFTSLPPGTYAVTVTATNYTGDSASGVVVPINGTKTKDFALVPLPGTLQGVVTSTNPAGTPIVGATVKLADGTLATTDAAGTYKFTSLPPGTYTVTVTATNYTGDSASGLVIPINGVKTKDFALMPLPGTLQGVVTSTNPAGTPIVGATVKLADGTPVTTDVNGLYKFTLPPGTYALTVTATNFSSTNASGLVVSSNATMTQNFALTPLPGALQGIVTSTNPAGTPIAGATVKLAGGTAVTTDTTGTYKFTSLAPGMYAVTVTATNFSSGSASGLVVASNSTTTQSFALTPLSGTLQGIVTSTNPIGSSVAGATLKLGDGTSVTTDAGGLYKFTSLPPGTYQVTVTAAAYSSLTMGGIVVGSNAITTRNFSIAPLTSDLAIVGSGPASATAGTSVAYTFTTTNLGVTAASGVVVKHVMPAQTTFTSVGAPAGWTCTKPAAGGNGTLSCTKSSMAVNESAAISVTVVVACPFPAATMTMAATATTSTLESSSSNNSASIVVAVNTPAPTITGAGVDKSTLWPPNHKMVDVEVTYTLTGVSCVGARTTLSIASNEGDAEDYEVVDPHHIRLRSEREGNGSGRTYTITISATNDNKVFDRKTVVVTVVHDQGHGK